MKLLLISLIFCFLSFSALAADTVDINQASAQEIADGLKGVGMAKAEEIVRYRDSHGAFKHADELVNVKGIGLATVDKNREIISLGAAPEPTEE